MKNPSDASRGAPLPNESTSRGLAGLLMRNAEWQSLPEDELTVRVSNDHSARRKFAPPEGPMKFPHFVPTGRVK